jgi:hypothetical protein
MLSLKTSILLTVAFALLGGTIPQDPKRRASNSPTTHELEVKLLPIDFEQTPKDRAKAYQLSSPVGFRVIGTNKTTAPVKTVIVEPYYQNRPELFKGSKVIPYKPEISKILPSKDTDPVFIRVGSIVVLEPGVPTVLEDLYLSDWYRALEPGSYRITTRHRFELFGGWSEKSAEVLFDIVAR